MVATRLTRATSVPLRTAQCKLRSAVKCVVGRISPRLLSCLRYRRTCGRWPNLDTPTTLDEKLLWLMLYWRDPLKSRCADKYAVQSYVEENGLGCLLPPRLGVYSRADEIDLGRLPDRFVLKATHGSGFNIICTDKRTLDVREARRQLNAWLKIDISKYNAELHYASITPRIVCEAFLEEAPGKPLTDYKVYCFNGRAHCTMACSDRNEHGVEYHFYDMEWRERLPYCRSTLSSRRSIPKPAAYEEIIAAAEKLSKPFPFVRVDFYCVDGRAVFGEMTFTPCGSIDPDLTDLAEHRMGALLTLPERPYGEPSVAGLPTHRLRFHP